MPFYWGQAFYWGKEGLVWGADDMDIVPAPPLVPGPPSLADLAFGDRRSPTASRFGCGTYEVVAQTRGGVEQVTPLPWTALSWERTIDDTSAASVTISGTPGYGCCEQAAGLRPWEHELAIYRNGILVWAGPIFTIGGSADSLTIEARDVSAWLDHRFVHQNHAYANPVDAAVIFRDVFDDAMAPDPSPRITLVARKSGVKMTQQLNAAEHLVAGQVLRDLSSTAVDWVALARLIVTGGKAIPAPRLPFLTDSAFVAPPSTTLDGGSQTNKWIVRGQGVGDAGDAVYGEATDGVARARDGLLEAIDDVSTVSDPSAARAAARSRVEVTAAVVSVDQCTLAATAPVTCDELVPGALCTLSLTSCCPPVSGEFLLHDVHVSANGSDGTEQASLSFQPPGETT